MSGLQIERVNGVTVARIEEEVDLANAGVVHQRLAEAVGGDVSSLIVDLGQTRYLDSAGLDALLRLNERLRHRRTTMLLVIPERSQLARLAAIVGLEQALPVHTTLAAAQRAAAQLPTSETPAPPARQLCGREEDPGG